ncbi:YggS family pyridoxal phosphate-dependent enzyme, partial [Hydrogenophaga sp.]|uniref:YggS family pyridoxal phosphate-dependent enzyme n=1 Tax=Hydrogenophaga sp. TaxID=1904254 RepID=UPI002615AD97
MATIAENIQEVHRRIAAACAQARRPVQSVTLLAVGKTFPADAVRAAFDAGERSFGENYVQEAIDKIAALADLRGRLQWHLIGPLQSNKTRVVAEAFDWVHTVDRLKIAQRLSQQRPASLPPLQICLQVNISG